jgi:hypothetical protein
MLFGVALGLAAALGLGRVMAPHRMLPASGIVPP